MLEHLPHVSGADLALIGFLAFLEGILSIDNALVLAMMARHLPRRQQKKALTYGLLGAVVFRLTALALATTLIMYRWVKLLGGGYLVFIAIKHFLKRDVDDALEESPHTGFWKTVMLIEVMDIAFAVDSILAAVALTSKFWIIFIGGFIGVVMMRGAAAVFLRLLDRYPGFENSAFILVFIIGLKVIIEAMRIPGVDFHSASHPGFWIFWGAMAITIAAGFRKPAR